MLLLFPGPGIPTHAAFILRPRHSSACRFYSPIQAFQRMMEEELKAVAAKEAEEAEEEAGDKEDREMFEQRSGREGNACNVSGASSSSRMYHLSLLKTLIAI